MIFEDRRRETERGGFWGKGGAERWLGFEGGMGGGSGIFELRGIFLRRFWRGMRGGGFGVKVRFWGS